MTDLYVEAAELGKVLAWKQGPLQREGKPLSEEDRALYWTARHAARKATDALLIKAREIGLSDEQLEALRAEAAEVAYD